MPNNLVGLYLHLGPGNSQAWERECSCGINTDPVLMLAKVCGANVACPACHGTGTCKRRLVGAVIPYFNIESADIANLWLMYEGKRIIEVTGVANHFSANPFEWSPVNQAIEPFIEALIAAHRSGELRAQAPELYTDPDDPDDPRLREVNNV